MAGKKPIRQAILEEGIKLTVGDRDKSYGDPKVNLGLAGLLKQICREYQDDLVRKIGPGEWEALDQVLTKVARVFTGKVKRDNYADGATYFAIAGELAERELTSD